MGGAVSEEPGSERVIADRYRLLSPLGEGGMGTVWRARDELLHREVAVKEVRAPAGLPASDVERLYARLEREAWAAARISDRTVVTVYDVAVEDGRPWIVMELVRGLSLADVLEAEGPLAPRRAARIGAEVLTALRAAHGAGVLHRDVKPANVLVANDGRVVLTDFGIAMVEGSSALTMTGEVVGSPEFLAPERALGRTPGPESDLWSLGVLLYAAVEGVSPFRQDTPLSTLRAIVDEELPPPRRAGPLAPVIAGLLRKDPAERLPAERAHEELRVIGAGGTPRADTARSAPYAPTVAALPLPHPETPSPAFPAPVAGSPTAAAPVTRPGRDRRSAVVLVVGVVVLALALAGLTYALLNRGDGGQEAKNGGGAGSPARTGEDAGESPGATPESEDPSPSPTASGDDDEEGEGSTPPPQTVSVTVTGVRTEYSGGCPPPGERAPAFTATFTAGRQPAEVSYRWVAEDGSVADPGWRTLSFAEGGGRSKQDTVTVTTYAENGTFSSRIGVEVRRPVHTRSETVPFSVTCETETPTGGASASSSGPDGGS
ncbi:serine/threonine protein kinase [Streptomyces sp. WAC 01420]|uniref:serine/threonine-protein kinase n=2 Tax=unclassified Streptomyces TaxID=2593676 RepID=UPI000F6D1F55|nr:MULTISPECIES: serine/threonine-protein kinase [unclassified Streptomyces]AZM63134.1 serine/threonine protein kinase [Streptomyces sp. WAC 01438]RSN00582.1 serine/threonine protein kinase [Streptomyces sp. WAC 01420]